MNAHLLVPVLSSLALAAFAAAQDGQAPAAATALPDTRFVPIHRPAHEGDPDTRLWAATDSYKAAFGREVTFIPYLGQDYPHNQPFTWSTQSIAVGSRELPLGAAPDQRSQDRRFELLWPEVTEAWDVRQDGLEQTFVFDRRPGAGDLVIRGAIATALATTAGERHGALSFVDAHGDPILGYGAATAIDARGRSFAMTSSFAGGTMTLRLPAADLAAASFPLVVDPLLTRTGIPGSVSMINDSDHDLVFGPGTSAARVFSCRSVYASALDADVWMALSSASYLVNHAWVFTDVSTAWSATNGRGAFVGGTSKWVFAYETYVPGQDLSRLRVHLHDEGSTTTTANSLGLLNATGVHDRRPDVGGTVPGSTGNHALIVFQRETTGGSYGDTPTSEVMALRFDTSTASGSWTVPFTLGAGGNIDCERPRVTEESLGGSSSWICVYQRFDNAITQDDWDLIGRRIDGAGNLAAGQWISSAGTRHKLGPVVAGQGGRYAVVFATAETSYGKVGDVLGKDIRVERFDWDDNEAYASIVGDQPAVTLHTENTRVCEAGGLAFDPFTRSHWAVGFRTIGLSSWYARVGYHGEPTEGPLLAFNLLPTTSTVNVHYDRSTATAVLNYTHPVPSQPGYSLPYAQTMTYPAPVAPTTSGAGCSTRGLIWSIAGSPTAPSALAQQIGNEFTTLGLIGFGGGDIHIPVVSLVTDDAPVPVAIVPLSCRLLVSTGAGYLGALPVAIGANPTWPIALPEGLPAMTLHFQDWVFDTAMNTVRSTARLSVPLVK